MAGELSGVELQKAILAEIREMRGEINKLQGVLLNLERNAAKPESPDAKMSLKALNGWMISMVESQIVLTRLIAGELEAHRAAHNLSSTATKSVGPGPMTTPTWLPFIQSLRGENTPLRKELSKWAERQKKP